MSPMLLEVTAHEVVQRGGGEEIFLPQPQLLTGRRGLARIQHFEIDSARTVRPARRHGRPVERVQPQRIGGARRP